MTDDEFKTWTRHTAENIVAQKDDLTSKLADAKNKNDVKDQRIIALNSKIDTLNTKIDDLQKKLDDLGGEETIKQQKIQKLRDSKKEIVQQLKDLGVEDDDP